MKAVLLAAALCAAACATPALADTMEAAFENTIVITYPSEGTSRYHFNRDGTFTATVPSGAQMRGRWEVTGDELCFISPADDRTCSPYVGDKGVGDRWEQTATDGTIVQVTIEAGRSAGAPAPHGAIMQSVRAAFGNTFVVTYAGGGVARYYFNEDHSFTATMPTGVRTSGLWDIGADQLCLTLLSGDRVCLPFAAGKSVGDSWTQTATDGSEIRVAIEAGR